jgi:hypothetical protein
MSWPKYHATETNNRKGEDFSHKERAISTTLAGSATDFLRKFADAEFGFSHHQACVSCLNVSGKTSSTRTPARV